MSLSSLKKESEIDIFEFNEFIDPYFNNNIWIFYDNDILREFCYVDGKYRKNRSFDFTTIKSEYIRSEFKFWLNSIIEHDKGRTQLLTNYSELCFIISFLSSEELVNLKSIVEIDNKDISESFLAYLTENGRPIHQKVRALDKNLDIRTNLVKSSYIYCFNGFYDFVYSKVVTSNLPLFEQDRWLFAELPFDVKQPACAINKSIGFKRISQQGLKFLVKKLCWYELCMNTAGTARESVYHLNHFSDYLIKNYPSVSETSDITWQMIDQYFLYLKLYCDLSPKSRKGLAEAVDKLFTMTRLFSWAPLDDSCWITSMPEFKIKSPAPDPYTDEELCEINSHLEDLDKQLARLLCIQQYLGCRISDICCFEINNLKTNRNKEAYLYYMQCKSKHSNLIPINEYCNDLLLTAIAETRAKHGVNAKYIFSSHECNILHPNDVEKELKCYSVKHNLKNKYGKPLVIKNSRFRSTLATNWSDLGIEPLAIAKMLGQRGIGVLSHYVAVSDEEYIKSIQTILEKKSTMIGNIGTPTKSFDPTINSAPTIPLPNGICIKENGVCKHANSCYQCRLFVPHKRYISVYKAHLSHTRLNIKAAKIGGYERLLQINLDTEKALEEIISKVEAGLDES